MRWRKLYKTQKPFEQVEARSKHIRSSGFYFTTLFNLNQRTEKLHSFEVNHQKKSIMGKPITFINFNQILVSTRLFPIINVEDYRRLK